MPQFSKILIAFGVILIVAGIVYWLIGNKLQWFGNLPGDIKVQKEHFSFYAPIASMLILSIVLSLLIWIGRKLFGG